MEDTLCLYLLIHQHTIFTIIGLGPRNTRPRPYLCAAVVHSLEAVDAGQRGIVHLPTGTGKTVQVGKVTEHYYHRGKRTLFLHHRRELRTQTLNKFRDFGLEPEVEEASSRACKRSLNPVIASVLSLQGSRLRSWPRDAFHLIVTDECHHAEATSYQKIYDHFIRRQEPHRRHRHRRPARREIAAEDLVLL